MKRILNSWIFVVVFTAFVLPGALHAEQKFSFEEDSSLPIVFLNIVLDAGAVQDPKNRLGLAHFSAHMMLRGTERRSKNEFFRELEKLGGVIEVDTREEGTIFRGAVLSENLPKYLELLEEAFTQPHFGLGEERKLQKEIEGEILERKGVDKMLVNYHFQRFFFGEHAYGNPVEGTQKTVDDITFKDVMEYYAHHYGAKNLSVFGTGDAKPALLKNWFERLNTKLGKAHRDAQAAPAVAKTIPPLGRRILIVDKPKTTQTQVLIGGYGMRPEMPGFYAVQLANHSFGGMSFEARMMREIRVKRGWTYGAYNYFRFGREPRFYTMYIFPKTEDTPPAMQLTLQLFEDFVSKGITDEEFTFARDSLVNKAPFAYDTAKKRLDNLTTEYLENFPEGYFRAFASKIDAVTKADVLPALQKSFHPENLVVTVVGDASKLKGPLSKLPKFEPPAIKNYLQD